MTAHPTPQPSGRQILHDFGCTYPVFTKEERLAALAAVQRQLFNAIMEIVGENDRVVSRSLMFDSGYKIGRNELRAELREHLATFFNQPEGSGKDGRK